MRSLLCWLFLSSVCVSQTFDQKPQTKLVPLNAPLNAPVNRTGFGGKYGSERVWRTSQKADYHRAAVRVKCNETAFGGSGAVVAVDGDGMFTVTNHHVIEGSQSVTIHATDGSSCKATVIWSSPQLDLAVCYCPGKPRSALPINLNSVPVGADVELLGYGGPHQDLRHVLGKKLPQVYSYPVSIDCATISGDSGGGMVYQGGLCGINFGGPGVPRSSIAAPGGPWSLVHPASSQVDGHKLVEVMTQICRPYGCRPVVIGQPVQPPTSAVSVVEIVDALKSDPEFIASIRGPQGVPGAQGSVDNKQLDAAISQWIMANRDKITISLALVDESGKEIDRDTVSAINGVLRLQLVER